MARRDITTKFGAKVTPNAQVIDIQVPFVLDPSGVVGVPPSQSDSCTLASSVSVPRLLWGY